MEADKLKGRDFWDANPLGGHWSSYKKKVQWVLNTDPYICELLTEGLTKGKRVLDVGCGPGLAITLTAKHCSDVVGLDYSETSLREAKAGFEELKLDNACLLCGDAENLPFSDNQFDVVYSIGVLHHTPDTQKAIGEIFRVLKVQGKAIIMLYKAYTPKWLAVSLFRAVSWIVDRAKGEEFYIANKLRKRYERGRDSLHGTALLELFGCPTLKMYSRRQARQMFSQFREIRFQCYQPGFSRLFDFLPRFLRGSAANWLFAWFDRTTANTLGFYLVIMAEK
jgi:ubiquinone/menaquinone biosynthesis C-methylase UbiE